YNRHRYYAPSEGCFISQDPIRLRGGENLAAYVPNPTGWVDPWGLSCKIESLKPDDIRFSQSSVNGVKEIAESMQKNGWQGEPIDVVRMSDGKLTTFDNTRVLAAQRAGIEVQANVHEGTEAFPAGRWTPKNGVQPSTWEDAVKARIQQQ